MNETQKIIFIFFIVLLIVAGLFFILKPRILNQQNIEVQKEIMTAIEEGEGQIEIKLPKHDKETDMYKVDYEKELVPLITPIPFDNQLEQDALSTVNGIGIIVIDSIGLKLPVVTGVEGGKLKTAVGHLENTVAIGKEGNCIIVGHSNYTYDEMFNRLDEVDVGDIIMITTIEGIDYQYKVYALSIVEPGANELFECDVGQHKLTLLTCTPIRRATHRLLVMAELME